MMRMNLPRALHQAHRLAAAILGAVLVLAPSQLAAADDPTDPGWAALHQESRQAIATLAQALAVPLASSDAAPVVEPRVRTLVIGFTGGLERRDSRVSGVVRLRRSIDTAAADADVTALAYNHFSWREATRDVLDITRDLRAELGAADLARVPVQPLVIVYGHSWGAGAIGKFARALREHDIEVALAVYIDAFTVRAPRVPDNVRYAINLYQRAGLLRGWPLRGKSSVVAEAPQHTIILANLQVTPNSGHFGWNWNLVQPLLYRQHHRIGHDVRIRQLLLDVVAPDASARNRTHATPNN